MERESRTRVQQIALYEKTVISFVREAAAEGADQKLPFGMTVEQWGK